MAKQRVLLIESDPLLREFLEKKLEERGYVVSVTRAETDYDLVLSNIKKPFSLDTFEALLAAFEQEKETKKARTLVGGTS